MSKFVTLIFLFVIAIAFVKMGESREPCKCPSKIDKPVCGSDGRTYASEAALNCYNKCHKANVKAATRRPCKCKPCATTLEYWPVCASNGRSYGNLGSVRCYNRCNYPPIMVVKSGRCNGN